ncbi:MAG: glycosyltransferase family 2 protein [Candidatus Omnitrophica bacterium]|nr:glycosyltransferase family 2 protein [Candidatus Omnitrophota bacterium]
MISIVIPVFNEAENIKLLYEEIVSVLETIGKDYEIIFVNDGSLDTTQEKIDSLFNKDSKHTLGIQLLTQSGKAAALHAGFQLAKGEIIFTLDGDLQDDPHEIPSFLKKLDEGYDLVSGWKQNRKDSFIKNNTSKIFNAVTNTISRVKLHDFNCGFKAYKSNAVKGLNLYGELHRYIPVLVAARGYKVTEIPVHHRKRINGKSKYGLLRFIHGALDIVTVMFITKFHSRPLHLFGYVGASFFTLGFLFGLYLTAAKFIRHQGIGERPLLLFSVMLMIMGVQIGITGLVSEQIATMSHKNEPGYVIKTVLKEKKQ